jgi:hypothetical protein
MLLNAIEVLEKERHRDEYVETIKKIKDRIEAIIKDLQDHGY